MANFNAVDLFSKRAQSSYDGNQVIVHGAVTPTGGALGDKYRLCEIPAGVEAFRLTIKNTDLDSNASPTLAIKAGYENKDGTTGDGAAFAAAGSTILQSVSGVGGNVFFVKPVAIEKDAILVLEVTTAAATFASGEIVAVLEALGRGAK